MNQIKEVYEGLKEEIESYIDKGYEVLPIDNKPLGLIKGDINYLVRMMMSEHDIERVCFTVKGGEVTNTQFHFTLSFGYILGELHEYPKAEDKVEIISGEFNILLKLISQIQIWEDGEVVYHYLDKAPWPQERKYGEKKEES